MEIVNKSAKFNYFILEEIECGIELKGNEVKSIKEGSCNIKDSYAIIRNNEVFVINMFIKKYKDASIFAADEMRMRKLLLHKKEIKKLKKAIEVEGATLVPLKLYFVRNKIKLLLGVCKGKKNYDKREAIKTREVNIALQRELKNY